MRYWHKKDGAVFYRPIFLFILPELLEELASGKGRGTARLACIHQALEIGHFRIVVLNHPFGEEG